MNSVTLLERHIPILTDADLKDEFIAGIISILQGKEPQVSYPILKDIFYLLVHGHTAKVIPGIPKFDQTGMKKSELDRYNKLQAGKVPSTGLDHSYKDLQFKPITTLEKEDLSRLYDECQDRINRKHGDAKYQRLIGYLAEVMEHCAASGELV